MPLVSSANYKTGETSNFTYPCSALDCSTTTITILFPLNHTVFIDNDTTTDRTYFIEYSMTPPVDGKFIVYLTDGTIINETSFDSTLTGIEPTQSRATLYLGLLILLVLLFIGSVLLFKNLERYKKNVEGEIMSIDNLSYLRLPLFGFAYGLLLSIFYVSANISYAFLGEELFGDLFFALFTIMMKVAVPMLIFIGLWFIVRVVDDKKIKGMIDRGVTGGDL